jgi:hypothetical protein
MSQMASLCWPTASSRRLHARCTAAVQLTFRASHHSHCRQAFNGDGLPMAFQLIGALLGEATLIRAGNA